MKHMTKKSSTSESRVDSAILILNTLFQRILAWQLPSAEVSVKRLPRHVTLTYSGMQYLNYLTAYRKRI